MTRNARSSQPFDAPQIPVQIKLAAAWTSLMFLYIYVDYLVLHKPGHLDGILAGKIWEFDISQTFMTAAFLSMTLPSLAIVLSVTLPARAARATNLVVAALFVPYSIFNAAGETWIVFFGVSIGLELVLVAFILRTAWTWPRRPAQAQAAPVAAAERLRRKAHA